MREKYESLSLMDLKEIAKARGLKGISTMKKAEIIGEFYRNCSHCFRWGRRCEYASICLNFDPEQEYIEFTRRENNEHTQNSF